MKTVTKSIFAASLMLAGSQFAYMTPALADGHAKCAVESGRISIVGNEFPAIQTVGKGVMECAKDGVEVKTNLTADHQKINVAGMTGNPAEYTSAIVANSSIVALMNDDLIRPLDDLVAKFGGNLKPNQLVSVNGKVMAVAFMANAQHLVFRKDILEKAGLTPPKTYEEMIAGGKKIKEMGLLENPLGGPYAAGWNLAQEFVNMYIGHGGEFYKAGSAEVSINNEQGVAALDMLKQVASLSNPDYLTHDSNGTSAEWKAGNMAMMNMWGSRVEPLKSADGSTEEVAASTDIAGPMTVGGGSIPATTLWWDGFTISKNISDEDAEATFKAYMHAIRPDIIKDEEVSKQAVWLLDGYQPTDAAKGVFAAAQGGAKPYPMLPYHGLLHSALGAELPDYLQGKEDAAKTLADVEAAYNAAAKEQGFLN